MHWHKNVSPVDSLFESLASPKMDTLLLVKLTHYYTIWVNLSSKSEFLFGQAIDSKCESKRPSSCYQSIAMNKIELCVIIE